MQNELRKISSKELLDRIRKTSAVERQTQAEVIQLLLEVDRRRLYAGLGYRSLFDFCVKELKYSESSAWRRVSAMRLLKDIPTAEAKLISGELSLKTMTTVQNFLETETKRLHKTYTPEQKANLLQSLENKTSRETEKILSTLSPDALPRERERVITPLDTEIRFVADAPLVDKLDRLKDLNSHRDPSRSYQKLFHWLSDLGLKQIDPLATQGRNPPLLPATYNYRHIPAHIRRAVWSRDRSRCTFKDPQSGRICGSTRFLEIDHIIPLALGGKTEVDNLRLYCKTHNLYAARKTWGDWKIDQYS